MFGCLRRLGCLFLLAVIAAAAWFTRDRWLHTGGASSAANTASIEGVWEPLSPAAGQRARSALDGLRSPSGPVFVTLRPAEVGSYVFLAAGRGLPASADSVEATAIGDALFVRAVVPVKDVAGSGLLGPLGGLLNDRERLQIGGTLEVLRPGTSQFRVREIRLRDFGVPKSLVPKLAARIGGARPAGMADDAIPVPTPDYVGDVKIANGRVTIYRGAAGPTP